MDRLLQSGPCKIGDSLMPKINWRIKLKDYYTTPEKEKLLNKHLRLVYAENPGAFREEIFTKLEHSLNTRSLDN